MNNIRKLRVMRKMTQQDLANEVHVERTSISKYEKYDVLPNKEVLFHLADFFNVSLDFLLGRNTPADKAALTLEQMKLLDLYADAAPRAQEAALMVLELGQAAGRKAAQGNKTAKQDTDDTGGDR